MSQFLAEPCTICLESLASIPDDDAALAGYSKSERFTRQPWLGLSAKHPVPRMAVLPNCHHSFHSHCILRYLYNNGRSRLDKCPNCRSAIDFKLACAVVAYVPNFVLSSAPASSSEPSTPFVLPAAGVPGMNIVGKLHRDLAERQRQIEELELKLQEAEYNRDDDLDGSSRDELLLTIDELTEALSRERSQSSFLQSEKNRLTLKYADAQKSVEALKSEAKEATLSQRALEDQCQRLNTEARSLKKRLDTMLV
ncbi:hypothetical protein HDV03_004110 [Kappamyces sp. JEL0829]|nr:hypothetical protein HDV03_004110 [Kappamyces sp. JEL0829]